MSRTCTSPTSSSERFRGERLADDSEAAFPESLGVMAGDKAELTRDMISKEFDSDLSLVLADRLDVSGPMLRLEDAGRSAAYDFESRLGGFAYNMPASGP
jgi:hypothetical protein